MGRQDLGRHLALPGLPPRGGGRLVIAKGVITRRANEEHLSAQTIERDYILAHLCAARLHRGTEARVQGWDAAAPLLLLRLPVLG